MSTNLAFLLFLLGSTINGCPPPLEERSDFRSSKDINYRLPGNIIPLRYEITLEPRLEPNLNPAPFAGAVNIELIPTENTYNITLHTRQLNLTQESIEINHNNGSKIPIISIERDNVREFHIFYVDRPLVRNELYNLSISHYDGNLNLDNAGFYLAKYYDRQGRERRFATTQFQSTSARRAYPSFDEPHMKATFLVNLIRPENFSSIANEEPLYTTLLNNGKTMDVYKETVRMSTYLTAFVVSDYKHTNKTENQRVFADEDSVNDGQAEYALEVGIHILKGLEDYLNVKYSLAKMDQIAIPDDYFSPGAMENWGLVTYRKSYIVYPNSSATTSEHQRTIQIIAHEFAHQWFGNLVTCDWWKYIWLNEGFANYFESFAAALIRPDWNFEQQFLLTSVHSALERDSTNVTKPMNYESEYPGSGPPTYIAYQKAGSVIRMFEHFLTTPIFRKGLTRYLQTNAYRSVQPDDLYEALQKVVDSRNKGYLLGNLTVSSIMKTWDSQAGYPIVNVKRNYSTGKVILQQERFFNKDYNINNDNSTWYIPINFLTSKTSASGTTAELWMTERFQGVGYWSPNSYLILNNQQTGFYRVNYDETNWKLITGFLHNNDIDGIHVLNRAQLIDDAFTLSDSGKLNYNISLSLTTYMNKEVEWAPISAFSKALNLLNKMLAATPEHSLFENYVNKSLSGAYNHLGFLERPDDEHLGKLTRINVLNWLCNIGDQECRVKSLNQIRNWKANNQSDITPNLESPVFCGAMRIGNSEDWEFLYQKYEKAGNTTQRLRLLNGLSCSENKDTLNRFLDKVADDNSTLRVSDRYLAFRYVASAGNTGLNTVFDYIDEHLEILKTIINIPSILGEIGSRFTTKEQLNKLTELGKKYSLSSNVIESMTEGTKANIEWSEKYLDIIKRWLAEFSTAAMLLNNISYM